MPANIGLYRHNSTTLVGNDNGAIMPVNACCRRNRLLAANRREPLERQPYVLIISLSNLARSSPMTADNIINNAGAHEERSRVYLHRGTLVATPIACPRSGALDSNRFCAAAPFTCAVDFNVSPSIPQHLPAFLDDGAPNAFNRRRTLGHSHITRQTLPLIRAGVVFNMASAHHHLSGEANERRYA